MECRNLTSKKGNKNQSTVRGLEAQRLLLLQGPLCWLQAGDAFVTGLLLLLVSLILLALLPVLFDCLALIP